MKFTLSLSDYVHQYIDNIKQQDTHCPVCYNCVMQLSRRQDLDHMLECYQQQMIERIVLKYRETHGHGMHVTPESLRRVVQFVTQRSEQELRDMCHDHSLFKY